MAPRRPLLRLLAPCCWPCLLPLLRPCRCPCDRPCRRHHRHRRPRELVAARWRAGLTQNEVAQRLRTTKSAVSRLERCLRHRPTLTTIENYALVVGCRVEIHLAPWP